MKVKIALDNGAGELDSVIVEEDNAQQALIDFVTALGGVNEGDTFTVRAVE
jgi:hypothetical protein